WFRLMSLSVLLGATFVVVGLWLIAASSLSLRGATVVEGEVAYLDQVDQPSEGGTVKATWPVIAFTNAHGERQFVVDPYNSSRWIGDRVKVMYSPSADAKVYSPLRLWLPGATLICLGIGLIAF